MSEGEKQLRCVDAAALRALSAEAEASTRLRKNLNLHESLDDPVQRFLNAFTPGTYVRPHRHAQPPKWELFVLLTGRIAILTFDDGGCVLGRVELGEGAARVVEIAAGAWHALVALAPNTVLLEIKQGPYLPKAPAEFASWAPPEGDPRAEAFERWFRGAAPGVRFSE